MNTEEETRVKTSGRQGGGHGRADERGVKPACDRDPPRRSVEILRDLGLPTAGVDNAAVIQETASRCQFALSCDRSIPRTGAS